MENNMNKVAAVLSNLLCQRYRTLKDRGAAVLSNLLCQMCRTLEDRGAAVLSNLPCQVRRTLKEQLCDSLPLLLIQAIQLCVLESFLLVKAKRKNGPEINC